MIDRTDRFALPLLHPGQAQKEMTHNEALLALDILLHPEVEAVGQNHPPAAAAVRQCWIVGDAPTGEWVGQAGGLAAWTEGGWRFAAPREGMTAWSRSEALAVRWIDGSWQLGEFRGTRLLIDGVQVVGAQQQAIAAPAGGEVTDVEARATLASILNILRDHGLIARNAD
ncbi:DUF2793 domain-containing protein [Sphingomonas sp. ac-8]|uniref:DUF2793 domain-containing protein n=1 Tax=Sphingomonas sp. ac-8 TaxID=3242977 RepID=UPI003A807202